MAQDQFINITIGGNASKVAPGQDQGHKGSQTTSSANDLTVSWDSTKFTTFDLLSKGVMSALKIAAGNFK